MKATLTEHQQAGAQSKLSNAEGIDRRAQKRPRAKSRFAGNNRVRLEAARRTIEELEARPSDTNLS